MVISVKDDRNQILVSVGDAFYQLVGGVRHILNIPDSPIQHTGAMAYHRVAGKQSSIKNNNCILNISTKIETKLYFKIVFHGTV